MLTPGLCSMSFLDRDPEAVVALCREQGVRVIEWAGKGRHLPPETPAGRVTELKRLCREAEIATPSFGSYFDVYHQSPEEFAAVLEIAAGLEADTVRVWSGSWEEPGELPQMSEAQLVRLAERSRGFARQAAAMDLRLAFEYHLHMPTCGAAEMLTVLERADHPNAWAYFQMITAPRRSVEQNLADLELVRSRLAYVHVHYFEGEELLPLAAGDALWRPLLGKIATVGYAGPLYLEYYKDYTPELFAADLEYLRRSLRELGH